PTASAPRTVPGPSSPSPTTPTIPSAANWPRRSPTRCAPWASPSSPGAPPGTRSRRTRTAPRSCSPAATTRTRSTPRPAAPCTHAPRRRARSTIPVGTGTRHWTPAWTGCAGPETGPPPPPGSRTAREPTPAPPAAELYQDAQRAYGDDPGYVIFATMRHTYAVRDTGHTGPAPILEPHTHGVTWGPWWALSQWTPRP